MNILEYYKKEAEKLQKDIEQSSQGNNSMHMIKCMQVVNRLQQVHTYLHDLTRQLNFVGPEILVDIPVDPFGTLQKLRQGDYKLFAESNYRKESVCLLFSLQNENNIEIELDESSNAGQKLEILKDQGLLANYTSRQPLKVSIQGYVPVKLEFSSDFEESSIRMTINNFNGMGTERYLLNIQHVTDNFLNELGAFITRGSNNLKDVLLEDSQGISLTQRAYTGPEETNSVLTEEMDISRLRSLFGKEHRLYLTYHNQIKDIGSRSHGLVMGRAKDCELVINSDLASRHHAQLVYRKGKFVLIDQSTNGTFVKPQGGKEVYVQSETLPLAGSGFISLGKAVTVDNEHLIYYSCQ